MFKKDFKIKKMRGFIKLFTFIIIFLFVVFSFYTLYPTRYTLSLYTLHPIRYTLDSVAYAGIQNTKHDLSVGGPGPIKATEVTEKCVFCHTPHASSGSYPLWNHALSEAGYTVAQQYTAPWPTLLSPGEGVGKPIGQPDGSSKLCLGCHDGTVAIGAVLNTPGRGSTGSISMAEVTLEGYMPPTAAGYLGTNFVATGFIKHPFSIAVNDDLISDKQTQCSSPTGPPGWELPPGNWMLQYPPSGDPVALRPTKNTYNFKNGIACGAEFCGVQCRSCHDPHDNTNGAFLVKGTPADNTPLCVTCHILCP